MSGLDATFLYFETPSMHMHVLGTLVVDPSTAPHGWSPTAVRDLLRERIPLIPVFRRRLLPSALRLHHPVWVDVHDVDVDRHLSKADCPAPGGMSELAGVVAEFAGRKLDRTLPLWELMVVDGLEGGRVAVVIKVHHSAVDGVAAGEILGALLDLDPSGRTQTQVDEAAAFAEEMKTEQPAMLDRLVHTATGLVTRPLGMAKLVPTAARSVAKVVAARRSDDAPGGGALPFAGPRVSFNGRITPDRVVAYADVPLEDVKKVKRAAGGTFNDVLVSVLGGAFRHYLEDRGELPDSSLIAVCPISVRTEGTKGGNAQSAMFTTLGTDLADPAERHQVVRRANDVGKADNEAVGGDLLQQAAEIAPPNLTAAIARIYSGMRMADLHPVVHNVIISNVPGPPIQLYFAGGAIEALYPLGPVLEGPGLNITVVSYRDRVDFGFIACAERMPEVADLARAVPLAMAELVAATAGGGAPS
jgi:diacylglycerol O-acyltransferase